MNNSSRYAGVFGPILIICGSTIGGGMLAIPSVTAQAGLIPSLLNNVVAWVYTVLTGLFLMDVCIWSKKEGVNLGSIAEDFFGFPGKVFISVLFVFLYQCLLISYFSGGVPCFQNAYIGLTNSALADLSQPLWFSVVGLLIISILMLGNTWIDRVNSVLMLCFGCALLTFLHLASIDLTQVF